jgi:1-acyl-sn-glycerol-3-phosphate acyltransferase
MGIFNHTAWIDAILLMWLFAPSGVSLANNANLPVVGTCIKAFQNIYVPRSAHGSGRKGREGLSNGSAVPSISNRIAVR